MERSSLTEKTDLGIENILDNAEGDYLLLDADLETQKIIARDLKRPIEERLEAFEDVIDSQIGDSTLSRARNIERNIGFRQLYLKFEGGNPTGTQKDRIAFAQAMDALRRGFDTVTMATCGNYGVAMALATSLAGLNCHIFIPENFQTKRKTEMLELGAKIITVKGDYEKAVFKSQKYADQKELYDANPGGANTAIQLRSYGEIAYEIYDELRDAPAAVAVPVSNGTTLAGIYKGFLSLYRRGKTSKIPKFIAGSSFNKNPIIDAYLKGKTRCEDLEPAKIRETPVNEPLINWHSIDGDLALSAIRSTNGWANNASDKNLLTYSKKIREQEGMHVLPASTAGLIALIERHVNQNLANDRYVAILTGRKT
jgi:threonine synthase